MRINAVAPKLIVKVKKKTVLVVDDDPAMSNLLRYMLAELGYSAIVAEDGLKGLEMAVATLPDCILLDLAMPNLDGYGFLVGKGHCEPLNGIPTIVLSSKNRADEVERAIKLGASGYITKPVDLKQLAARLGKFVSSVYAAPVKTAVTWIG